MALLLALALRHHVIVEGNMSLIVTSSRCNRLKPAAIGHRSRVFPCGISEAHVPIGSYGFVAHPGVGRGLCNDWDFGCLRPPEQVE